MVAAFNVVYKNTPGFFSITSENVSWATDRSKPPELSFPMSTVKNISVNVAPTPALLKVTRFLSPEGKETSHKLTFSSAKDRDDAKNILAKYLESIRSIQALEQPKDTGASSRQELEIKLNLLSTNKSLAKLHLDLVQSGIVSEDEFWSSRRHLIANQLWQQNQKRGTSSASRADVKPTTDDSKAVYTLNPEIIHSIFTQYPTVHKAYKENVPSKMSEKDFWTTYFQSRYFRRTRFGQTTGERDEFFDQYADEDEDDTLLVRKKLKYEPTNRLLDLSQTLEDRLEESGNKPDVSMTPGGVKTSLPLIRRFNRHSEIVLNTALKELEARAAASTSSTQTPSGQQHTQTAKEMNRLYMDETDLEDLAAKAMERAKPLFISDASKYFESQSADSQSHAAEDTKEAIEAATREFRRALDHWKPNLPQMTVDPSKSNAILNQLNQLTAKRKLDDISRHDQRLNGHPTPQIAEATELLLSINEILRHFWLTVQYLSKNGVKDGRSKLEKLAKELERRQGILNTQVYSKSETIQQLVESVRMPLEKALAQYRTMAP
ncbi:BSD domain-containing protein [Polychytrium aggregatum]|uniref:BSD domain-containing protein n=1 Tax=Polychytrium aggregatum TaxID=110093 RepID=UPI0022FDD458|nr:BSD domain-containing protein [Polychytrium aggregatum]KAI9205511.1 BSD domain-containing protein [Polychytrium aggregatum]